MLQKIIITIKTHYLEKQSDPNKNRFAFSYTITIRNNAEYAFQLISRHWLICDANNKTEEVYGKGVIGQQPIIEPGAQYQYSSGAIIETDVGTMEGRYFMLAKEHGEFEITIPKFILAVPRVLH
jgi:ApaG protein